MKKLLSILCLLFLVSYSYAKEVPSHRLIKNGGMAFEMGSNNPFTGTSTSYCNNAQPNVITTYKNGMLAEQEYFLYYDNNQLGEYEKFIDNNQLGDHRKYIKRNSTTIRIRYQKDGSLYDKDIIMGKGDEELMEYESTYELWIEGKLWNGDEEGSFIETCDLN